MTDEELIARLRERPFRLGFESEEQAKERRQKEREIAADRIEALVKELDRRTDMHECAMSERDDATLYADEQKTRAERLEAALRQIANMPDYRLPKPQDIARAAITEVQG